MLCVRLPALIVAAFVLLGAASPSPSASPTPAPAATPTPVPEYSLDGSFSAFEGASDVEVSNALLVFTKNTGTFRFGVTAGAYNFAVVGQPIAPAIAPGVNTMLYGYVPDAYVAFVPDSHLTVSAGKLATLFGQENAYTFQNINIQRGLGWNAEPVVSRGVRATWTQGKFTGNFEVNDGYYGGTSSRAIEGLFGWAPGANTNLQFVFIVPGADSASNPTAAVANKREYDLMLTQQAGKLQLLPYVLYMNSPSSTALGYTKNESALALVLLANYAFNASYTIGGRVESFANSSALNDASPNADFLGYGPGSSATSYTITPAYKMNTFFARMEYSFVQAKNVTSSQSRILVELGVEF
jgi:hypothetical protein